MSENKDLNSIIKDMNNIDNEREVSVPLFQDMRVETPFRDDMRSINYSSVGSRADASGNDEYTLIGSSTVLDSNITCGGNIEVKGQIKGNMIVAGSADIFGAIDGDIEASDITVESGAKINGNLTCKSDLNVTAGSAVVGNIIAKNAYVDSSIEGNIETTGELRISGTGSILGDIITGNISVANGAIINGKVSIKRQ